MTDHQKPRWEGRGCGHEVWEEGPLFRLLAEEALVGVYLIVGDRFVYFNPAGARLFGYEPEEIIDRLGPMDLTHPDDRPLVSENLRKRMAGELESVRYVFRGLRKDGSSFYVEVLGRRVLFRGETAILGTLIDVTERVRREQEEALLTKVYQALSQRRIGETLNRALAILGEAGMPIDGASLLVQRREDAQLRLIKEWIRPEWEGRVRAILRELFQQDHAVRVPVGLGSPLDAAMTAGAPLYLPDLARAPHYWGGEVVARHGVRSLYIVPLILREDTRAFLVMISGQVDALSEHQRVVLQRLAPTFGAVVEAWCYEEELRQLNLELEERVHQRTFELQVLYELSQQLSDVRSYEELFRLALESLRRLVPYDIAAGCLIAEDEGELFLRAVRTPSEALQAEIRELLCQRLRAWRAIPSNPDRLAVHALASARQRPGAHLIGQLGSVELIPLTAGRPEELLGALLIGAERAEAFSEGHRRLIRTVANQLAIAIQRLRGMLAVEQRRLATLVEHLPEGILLLDADHRLILMNPRGREYARALADVNVGEVVTELGGYPLEALLRPPPGGQPHEVAIEGPPHRVFEVWPRAVELGAEDIGWMILLRDVTRERDLLETERRRRRELEAINAIIGSTATARNLSELLKATLDHVLRALDLKMGAIWAEGCFLLQGAPEEAREEIAKLIQEAQLTIREPVMIADWEAPEATATLSAALTPEEIEEVRAVLRRYGVRASLTAPILAEDRCIGGLSLAAVESRAWTAEELTLVEAVGRQLGAAVERLRLFHELETHNELMSRLASLSETLSRSVTVEEVIATIGEGAMTLGEADRAAVYVRNPDETFACPWSRGISQAYIERILQRAREVPGGRLLEDPSPILIPDVQQYMAGRWQWLLELIRAEGYRSFALWPLVYEGRMIAVVACYYDATRRWSEGEREVMETFARQAAVALENARLYESLRQMNERLQEALRAKDEMIQNVSHELRTPLTLIKGYVELLDTGALGDLSPRQAEAVAIMRRQGERLHYMVNRLLMLQRLTTRPDGEALQRQPVDLEEILRNSIHAWQQQATEGKIRLEMEIHSPLPPLDADPELLGQVFSNLLDNAIKFSPEGGHIRVQAWHEAGQVCVAIADEGVGIPKGELERIFERFYQVEGGTTRHFSGMGIGLSLCRAIVEAHGGRIWAESPGRGQGSTFYVTLPAQGEG